ncbi:acyltransferase [Flavobacterium sp. 17A]|uniref:Acyltransferase n=1 Tax=Flavobacterium potami TaxID=2872310 RepID=A0A9X1HC31_9FLAO|nr:acyltransferase [Flavobacterium potami]MBZ4036614.1 acyltransferase [Flavobacterium potami]
MRIEQLTFTRFLAAVSIVFFHFAKGSFIFHNPYLDFLVKYSSVFVSYFFILSGFVMIVAYHTKSEINIIEYGRNRFARIYPLYFAGIVMMAIVPILKNEINFLDLFLNIFMIQSWIPQKALTLNVPGWSISVEAFFYILFPFLFNVVYKRISLKTISISIIVFWIISQIVYQFMVLRPIENFPFSPHDLLYFPLLHLNEFLIGNLAGIYFVHNFQNNKRNFDLAILGVLILLIIALKFPTRLEYNNGMLAVLFVPLIVLLSLNTGIITTLFKSKICVFLGEISFGIYLLQNPVWVWVSDYRLKKYFNLDEAEHYTMAFLIRFVVLLVLAAIFYKFFEVPVGNKIKKTSLVPFFSKERI